MPNRIPIPSELQHLIEKRDGEERRRAEADAESEQDSNEHVGRERRKTVRRKEDRDE